MHMNMCIPFVGEAFCYIHQPYDSTTSSFQNISVTQRKRNALQAAFPQAPTPSPLATNSLPVPGLEQSTYFI